MLSLTLAEIDVVGIMSRVFHTTCAATLLGGAVYLRFVLAPAARAGNTEGVCFAGRRSAWAVCVAVCTVLLLVSGAYNFYVIWSTNEKLPPLYHGAFGVKVLLAFVVFAVMALVAGKSNAAQRVRSNLTFWLNVALAAVLAVFLLGALLRSIPKVPKSDAAATAATDSTRAGSVLDSFLASRVLTAEKTPNRLAHPWTRKPRNALRC